MDEAYRFAAMGSPCAIRIHGPDRSMRDELLRGMEEQVRQLESRYSRYRDDSLTSRINQAAGSHQFIEVDEQTAGLLDYAETAWNSSQGLFDITSGVLRRAWNFQSETLPDPGQLKTLLEQVGWDKVEWSRPRIRLCVPGMELDFGGLVKEFAVDQLHAFAKEHGVSGGWIDLGGDVRVLGPDPYGEDWRIGLHPDSQGEPRRVLRMRQGAVASSGDYERGMWVDGVRYAHVLNPRSGWPTSGVAGVSVIADSCLIAGTASTVAMLQGEGAAQWLGDLGLPWLVIDSNGGMRGPLA